MAGFELLIAIFGGYLLTNHFLPCLQFWHLRIAGDGRTGIVPSGRGIGILRAHQLAKRSANVALFDINDTIVEIADSIAAQHTVESAAIGGGVFDQQQVEAEDW